MIYPLATEEDYIPYYHHLNAVLMEQNGKNGVAYFSPRKELTPLEYYLEKSRSEDGDWKSKTNILILAKDQDQIVGNVLLCQFKLPL